MIAYLILAHGDSQQVLNLAERLSTNNARVYVHLDAKAPAIDYDKLHRSHLVHLVENRVEVFWGGFSMVEATLNLAAEAFKDDAIDRFVLLSGACWPTKGALEIERALSCDRDYLSIGARPVDEGHRFFSRFSRFHLMDSNFGSPKSRGNAKDQKYLSDFLSSLVPRKWSDWFEVFVGANWWALRRPTIEKILLYPDRERVQEFMRYCANPDEAYFQTIAMLLVKEGCFSRSQFMDNLHYVDFSKRGRVGGLPKVLDETDFESIVSSGKLFARKFAPHVSDALKRKFS